MKHAAGHWTARSRCPVKFRIPLVVVSLLVSVLIGLSISRGGLEAGPRDDAVTIGLSLDTLKEARWQADRERRYQKNLRGSLPPSASARSMRRRCASSRPCAIFCTNSRSTACSSTSAST